VRRLLRRVRPLGLLMAAACQAPSSPPASRPVPPAHQYTVLDLVGTWQWMLRTDEAGTSRVERETWSLHPDPALPTHLVGSYLRNVEVRSLDGVPFQCNQRPWYRQRAVFNVTLDGDARGNFKVHEADYITEPSPCDHGFRHAGDYTAIPHGARLVLRWDGGSQTLWKIAGASASDPAAPPWPQTYDPAGAWRWDATSYDGNGNIRDETEWWQITRRSETRLDATYRRRVTVRSPDGQPIACANAPSWSFDDAFVLEGQKEEEHWHFYERAVAPGDHPCLKATPKRNLDEATAEQIGDFFVLEWRGKRREILYRAE
jgi:hypothetical protein